LDYHFLSLDYMVFLLCYLYGSRFPQYSVKIIVVVVSLLILAIGVGLLLLIGGFFIYSTKHVYF